MRFINCVILLIAICIVRCDRGMFDPDAPLYNKFMNAYIELIRMSAIEHSNPHAYADSTSAVLDRIQLTQNDYNRMITYLNKKPERWHTFLQDVLKEIDSDKSSTSLQRKSLVSD